MYTRIRYLLWACPIAALLAAGGCGHGEVDVNLGGRWTPERYRREVEKLHEKIDRVEARVERMENQGV